MISKNILPWYLRELNKLKEELALFPDDRSIWSVKGDINNSPGTLTLHLIGNLKHFIGGQLGNTGYVRDRDKEFSERNISAAELIRQVDEVIAIVQKTLTGLSEKQLEAEFPLEFLGAKRSTGEILFILYGHLNYHLGQINYYRRTA